MPYRPHTGASGPGDLVVGTPSLVCAQTSAAASTVFPSGGEPTALCREHLRLQDSGASPRGAELPLGEHGVVVVVVEGFTWI